MVKKIWLNLALVGYVLQMQALSPSISTDWQCFPGTENVKGFCVWTYKQGKTFLSNIVKYPPEKVYQYLVARAKNNPFEAIGAITLVFLVLLLFFIAYWILYRIVYWIIVSIYRLLKKPKKE